MSALKTAGEIGVDVFEEAVHATATAYVDAIRPIYGATSHGRPFHIGTCTLLERRGRKYLITAAHVVDWNSLPRDATTLYVGGKCGTAEIQREFWTTAKHPKLGRAGDHYDVAFCEVDAELADALGEVRYICEDELTPPKFVACGRMHAVLGYPNSKNKDFSVQEQTISASWATYYDLARDMPDMEAALGVLPGGHIFVRQDKKHGRDEHGNITNLISLKGISGGPLFDIGDPRALLERASLPIGRLAGIFIENVSNETCLMATDVHLVLDCLSARAT